MTYQEIVEKLLGEDFGVAGIAIDAAQIKGVLPLPLSVLQYVCEKCKAPTRVRRTRTSDGNCWRKALMPLKACRMTS